MANFISREEFHGMLDVLYDKIVSNITKMELKSVTSMGLIISNNEETVFRGEVLIGKEMEDRFIEEKECVEYLLAFEGDSGDDNLLNLNSLNMNKYEKAMVTELIKNNAKISEDQIIKLKKIGYFIKSKNELTISHVYLTVLGLMIYKLYPDEYKLFTMAVTKNGKLGPLDDNMSLKKCGKIIKENEEYKDLLTGLVPDEINETSAFMCATGMYTAIAVLDKADKSFTDAFKILNYLLMDELYGIGKKMNNMNN